MQGTTRGRGILVWAVAAAALVAALVAVLSATAGPAGAAFPGENGRVVFEGRKYAQGGGTESAVLAVEPDGSGYARIVEGASDPAVSPDGTEVAFARGGDVWVMAADGSGQRRLTGGEANDSASDSSPAWSPDGRRIAFARAPDGCYCSGEDIYSVGADGSAPTDLTAGRGFAYAEDPAWSPNGKRIAFTAVRGEEGARREGVFLMDPDGSRVAELAVVPSVSYGYSFGSSDWSPDGARVAFDANGYKQNPDVYVVPADGSGPRGIDETTRIAWGKDPAWSPDGARVAFDRACYNCYDHMPFTGQGVYSTNPDGSGEARLTTPEQGAADGHLGDPDWGVRPGTAAPPADRAPVAARDSYVGSEDRALLVRAPGVLKNDRDPEGDALSAGLAVRPRHGTLRLNPGGSFAYRPERDFSGADYFSYRASDGRSKSGVAQVRVYVRGRPG